MDSFFYARLRTFSSNEVLNPKAEATTTARARLPTTYWNSAA